MEDNLHLNWTELSAVDKQKILEDWYGSDYKYTGDENIANFSDIVDIIEKYERGRAVPIHTSQVSGSPDHLKYTANNILSDTDPANNAAKNASPAELENHDNYLKNKKESADIYNNMGDYEQNLIRRAEQLPGKFIMDTVVLTGAFYVYNSGYTENRMMHSFKEAILGTVVINGSEILGLRNMLNSIWNMESSAGKKKSTA